MKYKTFLVIGNKEIDVSDEVKDGLFNLFCLIKFKKIGYVNNSKYHKSSVIKNPSSIIQSGNEIILKITDFSEVDK